jgi:hypothetical protein
LGLEGESKEGDKAEEGDEFHGKYLYGLEEEGEGIFQGEGLRDEGIRGLRKIWVQRFPP